jgi:hypothetical protein
MLIGRIGAGAWFPLGGNGTWTARESGRLYLLYNDAAGRYSDNSGGYQVEVEVVSAGGQ